MNLLGNIAPEIPAALFGLTLHGPIEVVFSEPWLAAVALIVLAFRLARLFDVKIEELFLYSGEEEND